jgi:hypothetical protein
MKEDDVMRETRLSHEAVLKATRYYVRNSKETEIECEKRLRDERNQKKMKRNIRNALVSVLLSIHWVKWNALRKSNTGRWRDAWNKIEPRSCIEINKNLHSKSEHNRGGARNQIESWSRYEEISTIESRFDGKEDVQDSRRRYIKINL